MLVWGDQHLGLGAADGHGGGLPVVSILGREEHSIALLRVEELAVSVAKAS